MKTIEELDKLIRWSDAPIEFKLRWCGEGRDEIFACACMGAFNCCVNGDLPEQVEYEEWKRWQEWKLEELEISKK